MGRDLAVARVAVIGTGMMGPGIAITTALAGHVTTLVARSESSLARGLQAVDRGLDLLRRERLITSRSAASARRRIHGATALPTALADAHVVFESIVEDLAAKQRLLTEIEAHAPPAAIVASNTSGLPITRIAEGMRFPQRAITAHFWNPPHLMPLVELVRGERTSDATVECLRSLLDRAGKRTVVVNKDLPGQLGNRLLHALFREAFHLVQEGVASVEDIDTAIKYGPGLRFPAYGLLEHADMVGLDMMQAIEGYLFAALSTMQAPPPFLSALIADGALGARTGRGLYDWTTRDAAQVLAARDKFIIDRLKEARSAAD